MINFLTGIDVLGNIDLNQNQLIAPRMENLIADPSGTEGQLYFNTSTDKLMLYANGAWVALESGGDDNTTYDLSGVGSTNGTAGVRLAGSDGTNDDVLIVGSGTSSVTRSSNTITVTSNDQFDGTVTSVSQTHGGDAFTVGGSPITGTGTLAITMAGSSSQYIDGAGNLTTFPAIPQGDITGLTSGNGISITSATGPIPEITNSKPFDSITLASTTGSNSTITNQGTITIAAGSNISTTNNASGQITVAYTGGTGSMTNFIAKGDSGNDQTISDGDELFLKGGSYMATVGQAVASDTILLNVDGTEAATASKLIARDTSGYGYVVTPSSGDSTTKIATTAFVQASLTGLLEFKGGFNASTGAIVGGGNLTSGGTRVAVAVGDYYVVTAAGNFFGNAATPLTTGDSVIVQTAAAVGTSVEGDFIVVQSDTDLATLTTVGLGNVNAGAGIGVAYTTGTATVTNTDKGSSQNIFKNVLSDSGTAVADNNDDTLSILGAGSVSTAVVGDTLTITGTNTTYNMMSATTLGLGKLESDSIQGTAANSITATASRTYGIQKNSSNQLVVNVPWVNDDTGITAITLATGAGQTTPLTESITGTTLTLTSNQYQGGANIGYVPPGGLSTNFLKGNGTWATPTNTEYVQATESVLGIIKLSTDALALAGSDDLTAITPSVLASTTYNNTYPASSTNTWTIAASTHGLGTGPFVIQTYDATSGLQVFIKTTAAPSTGLVTMATTSNQSINAIRVVMMKVW